jgi:hypothetical protein
MVAEAPEGQKFSKVVCGQKMHNMAYNCPGRSPRWGITSLKKFLRPSAKSTKKNVFGVEISKSIFENFYLWNFFQKIDFTPNFKLS